MKCPKCHHDLIVYKSSFEQYDPTIYECKNCIRTFMPNYVHGFNEGLIFNKQPETISYDKLKDLVKYIRRSFNTKKELVSFRVLIDILDIEYCAGMDLGLLDLNNDLHDQDIG